MNPSTTIRDLPPEMVCELFKHLNLKQLLKMKSVCKLWNELISRMKIERLNVDVSYRCFNDRGEVWYETHRPQLERDLCRPKLLIGLCKKPMLAALKYLKIYNPHNNVCFELDDFDFNELNTLQQLVQLDLRANDQNLKLNLPNLQIFSLTRSNDDYSLSLNCPKLRVLRYYEPNGANSLHVQHPDTIRILDTSMSGGKLTRFRNVEVLRTESLLDSSILKLKNLKTLHLNMPLAYAPDDYIPEEFYGLVEGIEDFMQAKRRLNRSDLEVYFAGVRLVKNNLSDIESNLRVRIGSHIEPEALYVKHFDRLQAEVGFFNRVDYNRLIALMKPLPEQFFERFWNLREVTVTSPVDEEHVLDFLQKIRLVRRLDLQGPLLTQAFFDRLPDVCSPTHFTLDECSEEKNTIQLDFAFIGKLVKLSSAEILRDLSWESVQSLILALRFITHFWDCDVSFKFKGADLSVSWCNEEQPVPNKYNLSASQFELEDIGPFELLGYLEKKFKNRKTPKRSKKQNRF